MTILGQFDNLNDAIDSLPSEAIWSSSFGNQGEGGCAIIYRLKGQRWSIENGPHNALAPFTWTVRET